MTVLTAGAADGGGLSTFDVLGLVVAGLALVVSIVGTALSNRRAKASEEVAREALHDARDAKRQALWSEAIEAVHRVIIDPTAEPVGDRMQTMRIRIVALVDGLPDWHGFDRWLATEHTLGAALGREVMTRVRPQQGIEEHFATLKPFMDWGMALAQNLRHFRKVGYSAADVRDLRENAWSVLRNVYERNGWGEPPSELEEMQSA